MVINPGLDASGNGNNWTPINIEWVVEGTNYDIMVDSPTNYGTDTGVGGEVRGNYATLNPLDSCGGSSDTSTFLNGNLEIQAGTQGTTYGRDTRVGFGVTSGKWYFEATPTLVAGIGNSVAIGWMQNTAVSTGVFFTGAVTLVGTLWAYGANTNSKYSQTTVSGATTITGSSGSAGDLVSVAIDLDNGKYWIGKNGQYYNASNTLTTFDSNSPTGTFTVSGTYRPYIEPVSGSGSANRSGCIVNFGQRTFSYTAPSGFKALCTQNLPEPTIVDGGLYMDASLYSGSATTPIVVTNSGFQPDFVWVKRINSAEGHSLFDSARGVTKVLVSNVAEPEGTNSAGSGLVSFNTSGFSIGTQNTSIGGSNAGAGSTYVGWNWKANGVGVTNNAGTIQSTVSANTTAGFSIVTYTGTGSNADVGHGLGVAPAMIIIKNRDVTSDWAVYHKSLPSAAYWLELNSASGQQGPNSVVFNNTAPTPTVFYVGTNDRTNTNKHVAYCFAAVAGYSAFGSYVGSTDLPFVYTGFRPRYLLIKGTDNTTRRWDIVDTSRSPYNTSGNRLYAELANQEDPGGGATYDILSNGFKLRDSDSNFNAAGVTYVYAAFAENPFKLSRAR